MLAAAAMGATAFQKGLGAIHALSHPVGALYDTHHGLTNAVFMPYVLDFNREALWDKIDRLAAWLGIEDGFAGFLDFILRLRRDLGIPHTLDRIGVDDARFDGDGRDGGGRPDRRRQPAPAHRSADALDLYQRALRRAAGLSLQQEVSLRNGRALSNPDSKVRIAVSRYVGGEPFADVQLAGRTREGRVANPGE